MSLLLAATEEATSFHHRLQAHPHGAAVFMAADGPTRPPRVSARCPHGRVGGIRPTMPNTSTKYLESHVAADRSARHR